MPEYFLKKQVPEVKLGLYFSENILVLISFGKSNS